MTNLLDILPDNLKSGLTPAEERVFKEVPSGQRINFCTGNKEEDDPAKANLWGENRTIRAEFLEWLCTNPQATELVHRTGLTIVGVKVAGLLNLECVTLPWRLGVLHSAVTTGVNLQDAVCHTLAFSGSHVGDITADGLTVKGGLFFSGVKAKGEVRLLGANIGGSLVCEHAVFEHPRAAGDTEANAFDADDLSVKGSVFLRQVKAKGTVRLLGADIGGNLECDGAIFEHPRAAEDTEARAFHADGLSVKGSLCLRQIRARGEVRLSGADIGGSLVCEHAVFEHPKATEDTQAKAFNADDLSVKRNVFLTQVKAKGEVRLLGADIGGSLVCQDAVFEHPRSAEDTQAKALYADRLSVKGGVFLTGVTAKGEVRLLGADIGGQLDCEGAIFEHPRAAQDKEAKAFSADGLTVKDCLFLSGVKAKGEVNLVGANIDGQLNCNGSTFDHPGGYAFTSEKLNVHGSLFWLPQHTAGVVNLSYAHVAELADNKESWSQKGYLRLDGFAYDKLAGSGTPVTARQRLDWLRRQPDKPFHPQPYEQLAKVFRNMGHEHEARKVLIAKQDDRRKHGNLPVLSRFWLAILKWTTGYGYRPLYSLLYIIGFVFLGWGLFGWADGQGFIKQVKQDQQIAEVYSFQPFFYSLDVFLPIVDLHQENNWAPSSDMPGLRIYFWLHIIFGWFFTTLAVLAFTGLVRKE